MKKGDIMDSPSAAWMQKYNLAKIYYEHYGNLDILQKFITKNGYEYDKDGVETGRWINSQRQKKKKGKLSKQRVALLEKIEMVWEKREDDWMRNYTLAKIYYEHYGNLDIKVDFITSNGYEYDENGEKLGLWVANQRFAYRGTTAGVISERHIQLLEEIGMTWFSENVDKKLQSEEIQEQNWNAKKKEIYNRFKSYLLQLNDEIFLSKEDIGEGFVNHLNYRK